MICGSFTKITFKLGNVGRKLGRHRTLIWVMEKRIIDELVEEREAHTIHIRKKWNISVHIDRGSIGGVTLVKTLVTTLVSTTHVGS